MTTKAQILAAIVARHSSIDDVGEVHTRERYIKTQDKLAELYMYERAPAVPKQIRGWYWQRVATRETMVDTATTLNVDTWECRGYMSFNDDANSKADFDALIEALRDAVRADLELDGTCTAPPDEEEVGVQLVAAGPVTFCGVLCHSAVLQLKTWSYL